MNYTPGPGWSLKVTDARDGGFVQMTSAARAIIRDNQIMLWVPQSEFPASYPSYRTTAFRHTGNYGAGPAFNWAANVEPKVDAGLITLSP